MAGVFGLIGAAAGLAGQKVTAPNLPPINVQQEQAAATAGNLANLSQAQKLASSVNLFNQDELLKMLQRAIPGYSKIQEGESSAIQSLIAGKVPDANVIAARDASKAVSGGFGKSEAGANLTMRDLGMSSLAATEAGLSAADRWLQVINSMTNPGLFNVSSMFVTPAQQLASDTSERNAQWNVGFLQNQLNALPDPVAQQAMGIFDWMDSVGKKAAETYMGSAMGGAGIGSGGMLGAAGGT